MTNIPIQDYAFYADESGISNDRYTVVGGITVNRKAAVTVAKTIRDFRERCNMHAELKWSKVSAGKEAEYRELIEIFFAMNNAKLVEFHAVSFDNQRWDHRKFNDGDSDKGLSKLYYSLIMRRLIEPHGDQNTLFVALDKRRSSTKLDDFHGMLNAAASRDFGLTYGPIRGLTFVDSKKSDLIQLNDVVLGAVASLKNSRHLIAGARQSKKDLANLVMSKSALPPLEENSPKEMTHFSFWNRVPQ